jgi:4-aminobutyrate aminotransferase-like enzyme
LTNLGEIDRLAIVRLSAEREPLLADRFETIARFNPAIEEVRGRGMLWAIQFKNAALARRLVLQALQRGVLLLQSGLEGESVTFAPPPVIAADQLKRACDVIGMIAREMSAV